MTNSANVAFEGLGMKNEKLVSTLQISHGPKKNDDEVKGVSFQFEELLVCPH